MKTKKFEYIVRYKTYRDFPNGSESQIEYLNERGQEGWELVSVTTLGFVNDLSTICKYQFYFKREL